MPRKKEVMEFIVQVSFDNGKTWNSSGYIFDSYEKAKLRVDTARKNRKYKYRILGRKLMSWCEIKEDEVKHGN